MKGIMRIKKIKSIEHLKAVSDHNMRLKFTHNANHEITNKNLKGSFDIVEDFKNHIQKNKVDKIRKNSVLAIEQILTATPEFFKNDKKMREWVKYNLKYLRKKWGENLVNVVLHLDEKTPHIHAIIVPVKDNKLNCKAFIGGNKNVLSDMQDEYIDYVKILKLERGEKGSNRKHVSLKEYYVLDHPVAPQFRAEPCDIDRDDFKLNFSLG